MRTVRLSVWHSRSRSGDDRVDHTRRFTVDRESTIGKQVEFFFSVSKSVQCAGNVSSTAFANGFTPRGVGVPVHRSAGARKQRGQRGRLRVLQRLHDPATNGSGGSPMVFRPGPQLALATMNGSGTIQDFGRVRRCPRCASDRRGTGPTTSSRRDHRDSHLQRAGWPVPNPIQRTANTTARARDRHLHPRRRGLRHGGNVGDVDANSNATITVTKA